MKFTKIVSSLLIFTLIFSTLSSITPVFAEERANESSLQSDITLVENTEEEITVQTNAEKENAVVSATLDKESNTFTINSTEENELGQMIEKSYNVIVNTATDEEFIATFIDQETGEQYEVNSNELNASLVWLIPLGVVLGEALIAHLISAGLAVVIAGVTYTAVKEVSEKLKKKKHDHYMAILTKGDLFIGNPLSEAQAVSRLKSKDKKANNVWSVSYSKAALIARKAGGNKAPIGPERDKGKSSAEGYYFHFHLYNRSGGHSFYY
ncbi:SAR2788 family putative toxin [Rossellomorea sp. YZS02]|uniref:SAR2788 family putative toxin n=1 Tax=Rossellomorea sp. YZS02 TaxID=3097358 RepID=UPI002A104518|nr:SAR2788 family putative toxin [Rossellomorea sp. YZS02]MDX8346333.1 SAR2788 family putative toxin [Rossellomorea sp. YZS02]